MDDVVYRIRNFEEHYIDSHMRAGRVKNPTYFKCPTKLTPEHQHLVHGARRGLEHSATWEQLQKWAMRNWRRGGAFVHLDGTPIAPAALAVEIGLPGRKTLVETVLDRCSKSPINWIEMLNATEFIRSVSVPTSTDIYLLSSPLSSSGSSPPPPRAREIARANGHAPRPSARIDTIDDVGSSARFHVRQVLGERLDELIQTAPRDLQSAPKTTKDVLCAVVWMLVSQPERGLASIEDAADWLKGMIAVIPSAGRGRKHLKNYLIEGCYDAPLESLSIREESKPEQSRRTLQR